jgi:hypothetical protein
VHPHLAADVSENLMPIVEFDPEEGIWERFDNRTLDLDGTVFLGHILRASLLGLRASAGAQASGRSGLSGPAGLVMLSDTAGLVVPPGRTAWSIAAGPPPGLLASAASRNSVIRTSWVAFPAADGAHASLLYPGGSHSESRPAPGSNHGSRQLPGPQPVYFRQRGNANRGPESAQSQDRSRATAAVTATPSRTPAVRPP